MKNIGAFTLCLFCVLILSCKKDKLPQNKEEEQIRCHIIKGYNNTPRTFYTYIYDDKWRINGYKSYTDGILGGDYQYFYNSSGNIYKVDKYAGGNYTSTTIIDYNPDNTVHKIKNLSQFSDSSKRPYVIFEYDNNHKVVAAHHYGFLINDYGQWVDSLVEMSRINYTWDMHGNVSRADFFYKSYTGLALRSFIDYEYDDKPNALRNLPILDSDVNIASNTSKNNIIQRTESNSEGIEFFTMKSQLSYSDEGYVVKATNDLYKNNLFYSKETTVFFEYTCR